MAENVEQPTKGQPPEKPAKTKTKPAKKAKPQKRDDEMHLPVLVEFTFSASVIFLILVFLAIAIISWHSGTNLLDFVLRTGIAMGVLGSLLMAASRQISTGALNASLAEVEDKLREPTYEELAHPENFEQPEEHENVENSENTQTDDIREAQ